MYMSSSRYFISNELDDFAHLSASQEIDTKIIVGDTRVLRVITRDRRDAEGPFQCLCGASLPF
jgi:hypothetical protein